MKRTFRYLLCCTPLVPLFLLIFGWGLPSGGSLHALAMEADRPFLAGETLVYQLRWLFIPAGRAVLQVFPQPNSGGASLRHFALTVRSNAFVDRFYKVRDRIDAWTDRALSRSVRYEKHQQEGRTRRQVVVDFDWEHRVARYANFGRHRNPVPVLPGTLDPLSAFFYVRKVALRAGALITRPISDGKKCVIGRARVIRRETIVVGGISYDTYLIEPELAHVGGVFEKSPDASIRLWVTADRRHLPVRIKSRVIVGSFTGDLIASDDHPGASAAGYGERR